MQRVRLAFQAPAAGHALYVAVLAGRVLFFAAPLVGHRFGGFPLNSHGVRVFLVAGKRSWLLRATTPFCAPFGRGSRAGAGTCFLSFAIVIASTRTGSSGP